MSSDPHRERRKKMSAVCVCVSVTRKRERTRSLDAKPKFECHEAFLNAARTNRRKNTRSLSIFSPSLTQSARHDYAGARKLWGGGGRPRLAERAPNAKIDKRKKRMIIYGGDLVWPGRWCRAWSAAAAAGCWRGSPPRLMQDHVLPHPPTHLYCSPMSQSWDENPVPRYFRPIPIRLFALSSSNHTHTLDLVW